MTSCSPTLLLILSVAVGASAAQRYGRADAGENNYPGGPAHSELLLQVRVQGKRVYFRGAQLRKMQRTIVTVADPINGTKHVYEGVDLEELLPHSASQFGPEIIEVHFGSRQSMTISISDLDPSTKPIVVDTVDGKKLTGYVPFDLITKTRQGNEVPLENVELISVKDAK